MKSKLHNLIDNLMEAIIPAIAAEKSYDTILAAFGCINARIAMAAPVRDGMSLEAAANLAKMQLNQYTSNALTEFLKLEQEEADKKALVDQGVDGFARLFDERPDFGLAALNGGMGAEAQAAAEEAQGSWADSPIHQEIQAFEEAQGIGPFRGKIEEGGNPGEFGYKVIDGEISPAGRTREEIAAEEAEQARLDTFKENE